MFKANPVSGVGLGGYWAAIPAYHDASGSLTPQEAHNDYLELLASGGIVGAAFGGWFLFVLAKRISSQSSLAPIRFDVAFTLWGGVGNHWRAGSQSF